MLLFGIDLGVTGAVALIDTDADFFGLEDLPVIQLGVWKFVDGPKLMTMLNDMRGGHPARVSMEFAGGMGGPTFGKTAIASLNRISGSTVATVMLGGYPLDLVSPAKWKGMLGLTKKKGENIDMKKKATALARTKFPGAADKLERVKDNNRAEALLIAEYSRRMFVAGSAP